MAKRMSTWRPAVKRSCLDKMRHSTRDAAERAMDTVQESKPDGVVRAVYLCQLCDGYHWGRKLEYDPISQMPADVLAYHRTKVQNRLAELDRRRKAKQRRYAAGQQEAS